MKKNLYTKALKHLKSKEISEKIEYLSEIPTNNSKGVYSLNDPGFRVGNPDPEEIFVPDVDGNWPPGVPGTPGEYRYVRPSGYWSGGVNWDNVNTADLSQNYLEGDPTGRNTQGLIKPDGTVMTILPPNSRHFILGPLVDGFVPNHTSDAYTNIGYIQKDTRQFVLLARIQGQWKPGVKGNQYPVWDGTSTGFTAYNANFTLEMAQWMRNEVMNNRWVNNVPYFYSGGVPQVPQGPADCPNCPPGMFGGFGFGGGGISGFLANLFGWGSGSSKGSPTIGTQQVDPKSGDAKDAGFPWQMFKNISDVITDNAKNAWNLATTIADKYFDMFEDAKTSTQLGLYELGKTFSEQSKNIGDNYNSYFNDLQKIINQFNNYQPQPFDYSKDYSIMSPEEDAAFRAGGGQAALIQGKYKSVNDVISAGQKAISNMSASDYSAYKSGGGDAALRSGKSVQDIIDQGKENFGQITDPYKLSDQEKEYLRKIQNDQGFIAAKDAQIDIEIGKLQQLDKLGKLTFQQKLDLIALQSNSLITDIAKGAEVVNDILSTAMLAKSAGKAVGKGISSVLGGAAKGLAKGTKANIGSTGLDFKGFQAITQGKPYIPSTKPQVLGTGAYSAPTVGKSGGVLGGSGAAKYSGSQGSLGGSKTPGGVVQSIVPGGAPKIPFIEPQSKVPAQTFDKGVELAKKLADPSYRSGSSLANKLRQQASQAGYQPGQTSISYDQIPKLTSQDYVKSVTDVGKAATVGTAAAAGVSAGEVKGQTTSDIETLIKKSDNGEKFTNKDFDTIRQILDKSKTNQTQQNGTQSQQIDATVNSAIDSLVNDLNDAKPGSSKEKSLIKQATKFLDTLSPSDPRYDKILNLITPYTNDIRESVIAKEKFLLKKVKSIINEQESVQPSAAPAPGSVPPPTPNPEISSKGLNTGQKTSDYSKAEFEFIQRQDSAGFVSGYLGAKDTLDLQRTFEGTSISWQTASTMIGDIRKYDDLAKSYTQEWIRIYGEYEPKIKSEISNMEAAIANNSLGSFYRSYYEVKRMFDITDPYKESAYQASKAWSSSIDRLHSYIKGGKINPKDPFNIEDPTVAISQQEKKRKEKEIEQEIENLKKQASDNEKAAQLSKLKGLGMGALVAGIVVLGIAVLAEPAIVAALGTATIRSLRFLFGLGDDALTSISTADTTAAGLGKLTGQVADDAATYISRLMKGDLGSKGNEIRNALQKAADSGDEVLTKKLMQQADDLITGKGHTWNPKSNPETKKTSSTPVHVGSHRSAPSSQYIQNLNLSNTPKGQLLAENRKRILREIKKPYKMPEIPKQKYKIDFSGKFSPQNTPDKTASPKSDELVASGNARGQRWRIQDKYWQGYETTERMNIIYDRTGHGDQYWDRMIEEAKKKNGWRNREIQEHLNIIEHEKAMRSENPNYESPFYKELVEQETLNADKDPLFKKVASKLKKEIDYPDKPSKKGYPNNPPPKTIDGWHPEHGQRTDYYNKLDPISANSMPSTGNPEIDKKVEKAKQQPK